MTELDFVIKNGHVVDPSQGIDQVMDIAILDDKIVALPDAYTAVRTIDAEGCYVTPGLIDCHAHVYRRGSGVCVNPEYMLATGVTACMDAGSAGSANFEAFYTDTVIPSQVKIKSYLNMYGSGQADTNIVEKFDIPEYKPKDIRRIVNKYRDNILGLKIRQSEGVAVNLEAFDYTVKLAGELGVGVCVHVSKPLNPIPEIANRLRKDDIFCHCYMDVGQDNIFDKDTGRIKECILEARARGVLFDAANGKMNFNIKCCQKALEQGFTPDFIGTDWTKDKYNCSPYAKSLTFVMAKYLQLGMSLSDVLKCVTVNPARLMGLEGQIGTLAPGACADVAIFKLADKRVRHLDFDSNEFFTDKLLVPQMVFSDGEPAFCQADFGLI